MALPQVDLLLHGFGTAYASGTATAYAAGTTTLVAWYTDAAGSILAQNPITLDANGKATVYSNSRLKLDVKNSYGVSAPGFPVDNIGFGVYTLDNWTLATDYGTSKTLATINAALAAIGSSTATLYFEPGTWAITDNLTIPANVSVKTDNGTIFDISSNKTLTFNGGFCADLVKVFTGSGSPAFGSKSTTKIYPQWFDAKVDGTTDDTAAVQKAIDVALLSSIREIYCTGGLWYINGALSMTLVALAGIGTGTFAIRGAGRGNLSATSTAAFGETIFLAGSGSSSPVLSVKGKQGTPDFVGGFTLEGITFLGSDNMNTSTNAKTRVALYMELVARTWTLRDVRFCGFTKQAIQFNRCYDGSVINCNFIFCGTNVTYASVDMDSTLSDNSNAIKFVNCHWEGSPFFVYLDSARNIFFNNCKFEIGPVGNGAATGPIIDITSTAKEVTFTNCLFSYFIDYTVNTYAIKVANGYTAITNCQFTSSGVNGDRWLQHTGQGLIFTNNVINKAFSDSTYPSIVLNNGATFKDNLIYIRAITNALAVMKLTSNFNIIKNNVFIEDSGATVSSGYVFDVGATTGNIIKENLINLTGTSGTYVPATGAGLVNSFFLIFGAEYSTPTLTINSTTPSVLGITQAIVASSSSTTITNLTGGSEGQIIRLIFTTGNTTINDGGNFKLSGNITGTADDTLTLIFQGSTWYELGRSVN